VWVARPTAQVFIKQWQTKLADGVTLRLLCSHTHRSTPIQPAIATSEPHFRSSLPRVSYIVLFPPRAPAQRCPLVQPVQEAVDRGPRDNVPVAKRPRTDRFRSTSPQAGQTSGSGRNRSHTTTDNTQKLPTQGSIASIEFSPSDRSSQLIQQLHSHGVRSRLFERGLANTRSSPPKPGTSCNLTLPRKFNPNRSHNASHHRRYTPPLKRI
jgi:hypothetical protein